MSDLLDCDDEDRYEEHENSSQNEEIDVRLGTLTTLVLSIASVPTLTGPTELPGVAFSTGTLRIVFTL